MAINDVRIVLLKFYFFSPRVVHTWNNNLAVDIDILWFYLLTGHSKGKSIDLHDYLHLCLASFYSVFHVYIGLLALKGLSRATSCCPTVHFSILCKWWWTISNSHHKAYWGLYVLKRVTPRSSKRAAAVEPRYVNVTTTAYFYFLSRTLTTSVIHTLLQCGKSTE